MESFEASYKLRFVLVVVYSEEWFILVPLYSVFSVYSVVLVDKITTEYTENTEKTLNRDSKTRGD